MATGYGGPERRDSAVAIARLETKVEMLEKSCNELQNSVDTLTAMLHQTKGGWFVISTVAAAAAAIGALVSPLFNK